MTFKRIISEPRSNAQCCKRCNSISLACGVRRLKASSRIKSFGCIAMAQAMTTRCVSTGECCRVTMAQRLALGQSQGGINPRHNLCFSKTQIFWPKGNFFFHAKGTAGELQIGDCWTSWMVADCSLSGRCPMGVPRSVPVPVISGRKSGYQSRHQLCQRTFATAVVTKDGDHPRFDIVKVITERRMR